MKVIWRCPDCWTIRRGSYAEGSDAVRDSSPRLLQKRWSAERDFNPRSSAPKADALSRLRYQPIVKDGPISEIRTRNLAVPNGALCQIEL
jgi:hypothetical protein